MISNSIFQGIGPRVEQDRTQRIGRFLSGWNWSSRKRREFVKNHKRMFHRLLDWFDDGKYGNCEQCKCFTMKNKCPDCGEPLC
jgi:hypothetical protein